MKFLSFLNESKMNNLVIFSHIESLGIFADV